MLSRRIIPCLDVRGGKLTKGIKFRGNVDIGDPVEMAAFYYEEGADELVFYDITASSEKRDIMTATAMFVSEKEPLLAVSVAKNHLTEKLIAVAVFPAFFINPRRRRL